LVQARVASSRSQKKVSVGDQALRRFEAKRVGVGKLQQERASPDISQQISASRRRISESSFARKTLR